MKTAKYQDMIIGEISENEETVRFDTEIYCSECKKKVPGGMKASLRFYQTDEFQEELKKFKKNYLCGICRDKKRRSNKKI